MGICFHLQTHTNTHWDTNFPYISFPYNPSLLYWPWSIDSSGHLAHRSPWQNPRWADLLQFCGRITVVQRDLVGKLICNWEYSGSLAPCHVPEFPFVFTHIRLCFHLFPDKVIIKDIYCMSFPSLSAVYEKVNKNNI